MDSLMKLVSNKTYYSVILEYLFKYKYMKEVLSAMDILITLYSQKIIRHNKVSFETKNLS